ncbi:IclR family transcriptional regulator C-terminal domain-containing protein [Streptomyces atratus]|uniref:IclR family transcriptional regulator domain-containing protein n=1 Tax=Streptomyces atratus TaxID=1893 RepID=UPI0037A763E2
MRADGPAVPGVHAAALTTVDALLRSLDEVRTRGYATEVEEPAFGRAGLAVPVRDRSGRTVASISVSGSLSAMDLGTRQETSAGKVIEYADQVSTGLGCLAHAGAPLH